MDVPYLWPRQADAYEKDLIQCCERIAGGVARRQSCTALVDGIDKDLFFTRRTTFRGVLERKDEVIIVDFLHSRSNLPAKLRHIEDRINKTVRSRKLYEIKFLKFSLNKINEL